MTPGNEPGNPETPKSADKENSNKTLLFSPRTRKEAAKQDRKLLDNNHFTSAKHQRKHRSPNTTVWQRWNPL